MIRSLLIFTVMICSIGVNAQFYNGSIMDFGKNRIQYKPIEWSFYRHERFDVFFYAGGKELSERTANTVKECLPRYEELFDYTLENRLQLIVFDRLSDLRQTNLGLGSKGVALGGTTNLVDNKILLYYEDRTSNFANQVRAGVAEALVNEFLYGSNFRERLRSSTLMTVPDWFRKGLIAYLSRDWNTATEDKIRDGIISGRYYKFNRLEGDDAILAGESIWHYIEATYGERVIPDILEMARVTRSVDNGFLYVLGLGLKGVTQEWINYYDKRYYASTKLFQDPQGKEIRKNKRSLKYKHPEFSKDGRYFSYVSNESGKSILRIFDTENQRWLKPIKMGRRLPTMIDFSFPVTCWHPNNKILVYTDDFKGRLRLNFYDVEMLETDRKFIDQVQKIISFDIAENGRDFAMVALKDGANDLFVFNNISNTFSQITNDEWDESDPVWMRDGQQIIFTSNRTSDSLKTKSGVPVVMNESHDLFQYSTISKELRRLIHSPGVNESRPQIIGNRELMYLSDVNGFNNMYFGRFDSSVVAVDTLIHYRYFLNSSPYSNTSRSLIDFAYSAKQGIKLFSKDKLERVALSDGNVATWDSSQSLPIATWAPGPKIDAGHPEPRQEEIKKNQSKVKRIVVFGEQKPEETDLPKAELTEKADSVKAPRPRQRVYETAYYPEYLVTRLDRGFLNQTYQPYAESGYFNPSINGLFRFSIADLFEDYRLTGGFRLAANLTGNEYLMAFESVKKRLDHSFIFHRQGISTGIEAGTRLMVHTLAVKATHPFSEVARVEGSAGYRNDRTVYLSTDLANLNRPSEFKHWAQLKTEYVFDNTFPVGLNMHTGMRMKVTLEHFHRLDEPKTRVTIAGFDIRNYGRISQDLIWAARVAGASSWGPNKVLFYLGGVDNWFIPKFNNAIDVDTKQNYLFQTLGTNVRGFTQNIRNGSSFAVINAELRWNIVHNIFKYPLRSDFLNSIQFIGFTDVGTAFTGSSPYSKDNTFNQKTITSGPITVILKNQREPIVAGFGIGLRTRILGYFVRLDLAKGLEDGTFLPSLLYLSFTSDF